MRGGAKREQRVCSGNVQGCSGYVQGMFRVCSVYVQGCPGYVQGMFRACSGYLLGCPGHDQGCSWYVHGDGDFMIVVLYSDCMIIVLFLRATQSRRTAYSVRWEKNRDCAL